MQDPVVPAEKQIAAPSYNDQRRKLLQMGAAGLPMVLTLRASASEALISQLQCLFTVKNNRRRILVDDDGRAWVGNKFIKQGPNGLKASHITRFINNAKTYFTSGTAPNSYRPAGGCQPNNNPNWTNCGYSYYDLGKNHEITPSDYLTSGGNWNLSGNDGLYLSLSITYADSVGNDGVWPGISCIVSILTYLDLNN